MCPRLTTPLTDNTIKKCKAIDKDVVLSDGYGLQLRVKPSGSKLWNYNYYHPLTKKRTNISLGSYPATSLKRAREAATEQRGLVERGIDPKTYREEQRLAELKVSEYTLRKVAEEWLNVKKHNITENHATKIWGSLERHVFPSIGNYPLAQIKAPLVIAIFRPIEAKGNLETVKRLSQRLNEVFNFAVNCGYTDSNPLSGIKAAFKKPKKESMASIKPEELNELMRTLAQASIKRTTRCLIEWQLHTMTRPSEAAMTEWAEIDFKNQVWTIPANKMKKRREHKIPLTPQMLAILKVMEPISHNRRYVFPSDREPSKHCHTQTANMALKRMGFKDRLVSHGLRALASTTLNNQNFDSDLIESALAHVDQNQVRAAYNRSDYLERRREMMCWWSGHIDEAAKGSLSVTGIKQLKVI
ncbi:integrase domain-containing protein [Shewanella sp. KCT]|uniref:integrase domain-containing protein n=1 Tax=Shewanella sp. KCT TaxID=2569535 RepID=UPI0011828D84|nr:integrase domain-containing protein [Shewanella sp. KCT]TVP12311.1 integrase [Shewanella sp. KCT]